MEMCSPWCTEEDVLACGEVTCEDQQLTNAIEAASYILFKLSRRKYAGTCTATARPHAASCEGECLTVAGIFDRSWGWVDGFNAWTCSCGVRSCEDHCNRRGLGRWPITGIVAVEIDGVALDADEYAVIAERWLLRMADAEGNGQCWPSTQRLDLPLGEVGTWAVTFTYGAEPPQAGRDAAAEFAREWCAACSSDGDCALPDNVQSYVRQGVTVSTLDPLFAFREGIVGLERCDRFLAAERYGDKWSGTGFYNPDDFARVEIEAALGS